ncbi:MAG: MarR family transcriptional regulator [Anaerolineales bacterium]|jgi:DNA-binding MarR family transcriptional regulator|nr:MarR family transcriptional regulator [Anaerolineales bacterium]
MSKPVRVTQPLREWMDVFMHRSMRGWSQFAKSTGLSMPQFSILMQLHYKGTTGLSEISERFDISAAAASQLVEKLVQSSYLERAEDPNDRRAKNLRLTPAGEKLVNDGIEERYRWMGELVSNLDVEDHAKISDALTLLTQAAQKMDEKK